jgi:flavodoxin
MMTRGLVVFESMFGNTQVIASSVADGLAPRMQVGVAPTALDGDVDLLVVGGPTGPRQSAGSSDW